MADIKYTNRSKEDIDESFKELVEKKITAAMKLDPSVHEVEVTLTESDNPSRGGDSHRIDVNAFGAGTSYNATDRGSSFEHAIDGAVEKLRRQLRKTKETRTVAKSGHRKPLPYGRVA